MDVTLLGTGSPAGLPRPGCPCAVCARCLGEDTRAATAVLVDGALLLDPGPGAGLAAARAGRSLRGVRRVLRSGPPDGRREGPAGREGHALSGGHRVRAVPLDTPGTGYAVTGPDGQRLLYLPPGAAPAGEHDGDEPYDVCLLDLTGRPDAAARLRAAGAAGPGTDLVAVHLDHDVPPGAELRRRLAAAGARAVPDGTTLAAVSGGPHRRPPGPPRRTLVLGGARSGKSAEAERRLAAFPGVTYVATGGTRPQDPEWQARVAAHRRRRPPGWRTEETCDLVPLLSSGDGPPLLIDCLSLWLTHAMDTAGAWDDARWSSGDAQAVLAARVAALTAALRRTRRTVVAVSNETGSGVVPATASGRRFRDELGRLNAAVAAECEHVLLAVAGTVQTLRG